MYRPDCFIGSHRGGLEEAKPIIESLIRFLADFDVQAQELWQSYRHILEPVLRYRGAAFKHAMENYDFLDTLLLLNETVADMPDES